MQTQIFTAHAVANMEVRGFSFMEVFAAINAPTVSRFSRKHGTTQLECGDVIVALDANGWVCNVLALDYAPSYDGKSLCVRPGRQATDRQMAIVQAARARIKATQVFAIEISAALAL